MATSPLVVSRLVQQFAGVAAALVVAGGVLVTPAARAADDEAAAHARLVVADAAAKTLAVLNPQTDERIAAFSMPGSIGNLVRSSSGRWVFAVHTEANKVTILDSGFRMEAHDDHKHLKVDAPHVRATIATGRKPIDFWAGNGMATVHNDDDGTLTIFDDQRLETSLVPSRIKGASTGHNNAAILEDVVLLSLAAEGRVTSYGLADGNARQEFDGCPGTHGWTTRGRTLAAAGCTDGVMIFTKDGGQVTARKVAEPDGSPERSRVSTLASHPDSDTLVGNFGQGLALVRADSAQLVSVPLPAMPVRFAFDHGGARLLVLTVDGNLHALDPASGQVAWTAAAIGPVDLATAGAPRPSLAVGEEMAYVSDPGQGRVVKVNVESGSAAGAITVGGTPTLLTLIEIEDHGH